MTDLFAEYAAAYLDGKQPRAHDYLARAGDGADELARLLDQFLLAAPRPAAGADLTAVVSAWVEGEPTLIHLRASKGVRVDQVVDAIVDEVAIAQAKREKVKRYYQQLEQGLLDPSGVTERVWQVLRKLLGPVAEAAASWPPQGTTLEPAFYRQAPLAHGVRRAFAAQVEPPPDRDEVDELFTGGR